MNKQSDVILHLSLFDCYCLDENNRLINENLFLAGKRISHITVHYLETKLFSNNLLTKRKTEFDSLSH